MSGFRKKDKEKKAGKKITKASFKKALRIFKYLKPYRFKFTIGVLFLLLSSATSMVFPGLMGKLVDANLMNGEGASNAYFDLNNINSVALALFSVFVVQAIFSFFRVLIFADVTENMLASLRQDSYKHLISLPMAFFSKKRVGDLNSRMSADISLLQETFTTTLAEFLRQVLTIIIGVALLSIYSYKLTLLMLGTLPIIAVIAVIFGKFIKKLSKRTQDHIADSNIIVEETLTAIASVKAYVNEKFEFLRYSASTNEVKKVALQTAKWRGAFISFIIVAMFGSIVLVIWYGMFLKEQGEISMGDLFSFILYTVFVGASFGGIADLYAKIQKAIGATENLMEILDEEAEDIKVEEDITPITLQGNVVFNNISFAYPSRKEVQVLNNISFEVKAGEKIALVGSSGAGKSTISNILLQFYKPNSGSLVFDGKEATNYNLHQLRNNMALVPQEVILFGGSIKENIAYGKPSASDAEILEAAKGANALEFIERFPDGLETLVGERGIQLSGGQRQRIAIARAILKNPSILILDEATSALDSESEKLVQDALERLMKNRTSFVIAHRLSTIKDADKIMVLQDGAIIETGNHNDLLAKDDGIYQNLTKLQTTT